MMDKKYVSGALLEEGEKNLGFNIPERFLKKEKIKLDSRNEKEERGENYKWFMEEFIEKEINIKKSLENIEEVGKKGVKEELGEMLKSVWNDLQVLNKEVFAHSGLLRPFDLRKCKENIQDLEDKANQIEKTFLPKKKFGFKNKSSSNQIKPSGSDKVQACKRSADKTDSIDLSYNCLFSEKFNETLRGKASGDVMVSQLRGCTLIIKGISNTITFESLTNCIVVADPVTTSVIVDKAQDCTFQLACQQLRIHDSKSCDFYLHVTTKPIVEDSSYIRLAPANPPFSEDTLSLAFLDPETNNWDSANDFNWLSPSAPSPNWSLLPMQLRISSWPQ